MSSSTSAPTKANAERHLRILLELLKEPGNEICADCRSRNPRWASWNLGIFICVKCAGIHRKLGTHITKVKSLTLDSWTKEQVQSMKQLGNVKTNQIYNPNGARNPPPTDLEESERDSQLEKYIRAKYESKRFMDSHRKHGSISSGSTSVSSAISFTMSTSPVPSPSSSIFRQSPRTQLSMPARSPSVAGGCSAVGIPLRPREGTVTANGQRSTARSIVTPGLSKPSAQSQLVSQDTSSIYHNTQSPQPPIRPSTAPITSDGYHGSQHTPPVPPVPSLFSHSSYHSFQGNTAKNHDGTLVNQSIVHQSINVHPQAKQTSHQVPRTTVPPPRTDGVWGDLMQLAQPQMNLNQPSSGFLGNNPSYNTTNSNACQPVSSTHSANSIGGLEAGMSRLMYNGLQMMPATQGTGINQSTQSTNPFTTYVSPNPIGCQSMGMSAQCQPLQASRHPAFPPLPSVHAPHPQSSNPFFTYQTALQSSAPSSTHFVNPHQHLNATPAPNRNPFLSANIQNFNPRSDGFSTYYPASHQQPSPLSINQDSHFFS